jgi:NADPH:quinone reductase
MRGALVTELGATPVVQEVPDPVPGEGDLLVQMDGAALNPVDITIAAGQFYLGHPPLPFVAGTEGVGRVVSGGSLEPGTRVFTTAARSGTHAERFLAAESSSWVLGEEGDDAEAAALGIAGLAGWMAVEHRGRLERGERVLVLGATGTVGHVAVQAAKLLGADRVVAAGRNRERLERVLRLGADEVVVLGDDDPAESLAAAFPDGGPELVIDPLWGAPALAAIRNAPVGMRLVNLGQSAGGSIELPSALVRGRLLEIIGHTVFELPLEAKAAAHRTMLEHVAAGRMHVELETVPLDQHAGAWERQRAGGVGHKLVITP